MKTNNNIPAYRFQGYTDAWELRKFDECFNFPVSTNSLSRALLNYDEGDIKSVHYGDILITYPAILNIKNDKIPYITGGKLEKYKSSLLENGDLIFADAAEDETVGKAVEVNGLTEENLVAGLHTIVARPKDKKAEFFLGYYINSNTYHRQLLRLIQGSKVSSISKGNLQKTLVFFPKDFEEQQKIGAFFKKIDEIITLHQRKLDTLKEQKKTYLKLLFPAKGQTKPALRFQGFEDDWEVKRISDIGDIVTGNTPSTSNEDYYSKEGMMWVTPTDIDGLIITDTNKKLSPEGEKVSRIVPANSILVTCIASIGKNTLLFEAGSFNQQINAVVPNQSFYHPYFLLTQSYFWSESMKRIAPAATMQIINKSEFSNITVPLPSLPEQEAIGTFFQTLDQEISQVEDKLASLKELKKTLLRKLFV
ncbi:restriction endonuclease subunit S [Streptococcus parasuis]|uniref:restriction endonuclease subunit S n=1 Tax=Streptococcus parasuis TaxID=1501662 RepID=UPI0028AAE1DF|nr:restriction endonuclease subunit S [Streptococcus parasuis]